MTKADLIIISNRLPVSVQKSDGQITISPSSGGVATAMASLDGGGRQRLWVGWPGIDADVLSAEDKRYITAELQKLGCLPVFLSRAQVNGFYDGYSNGTLWPLLHYFQSTASFDTQQWPVYREVNELFAATVQKYAARQALIWIHDYHLMPLPALLRNALPDSLIGFFLHTPFPSFEIFRLLPERNALLRGLLGADLIGFQTYDYVRHFNSSVLRLLGHSGHHGRITVGARSVAVDAFPIGIDYERFAGTARSARVQELINGLDETYGKRRLILSVDRLDYSKGINRRLKAFESFLKKYPKWHEKVVLAVIAVPSRTDVASYQQLRDSIEQSVSRINGQYGNTKWTPISYQFKNLPFEEVVALYAKADVMLVTPLRDGMNLVAKEFIACQQYEPGVLILSELTGATDELTEALHINPNDPEAMADTLRHALVMPKAARLQRVTAMQQWLSRYTVNYWAQDFIGELEHSRSHKNELMQKMLTAGRRTRLLEEFTSRKERAIFLDYDGTLTDFVNSPEPEQATPPAELLTILRRLAEQPHTSVTIVSGRTRQALETWFGNLPLQLVAEHGAWIRQRKRWSQAEVSLQPYRDMLHEIMLRYADRTPGAEVEEKNAAIVWHYRNVVPELAYARSLSLRHELQTELADSGLGVHSGHGIIEVRPRGISKGQAVAELLAGKPADFILCIGDDYTDEDMFGSLADAAYTIRVGPEDTRARYRLLGVNDVIELLKKLLQT